VFQRLAIQKFHSDERLAFRFADVVNRADVGMVQGGCGLRLSLETRERLRIVGDVVRQEFQRDKAVQAGVLSFVHHAHAPATEAFHDAIVRKGLSNQRIVRGHVLHILGCEKMQVNGERQFVCLVLIKAVATSVRQGTANVRKRDRGRQPPAMAPTIRSGSFPETTASGSGVSS